jgi:general L-amino acid transport system permease protein
MSMPTAELEPIPVPEPPTRATSPAAWARENLFYNLAGSSMTLVFAVLSGWVVWKVIRFVFVSAHWEIIRRNLTLFMVGRYPRPELTRLWIVMFVIAALAGIASGLGRRPTPGAREMLRRWWPMATLIVVMGSLVRTTLPIIGVVVLVAVAFAGRAAGARLPRTRAIRPLCLLGMAIAFTFATRSTGGIDQWGGLLLTLTLAVAGIAASFPFGVALALGRRSSLPAIRVVSVIYIELFRGVPLVTVLFMGDLLLGFFLPPGSDKPQAVTRALVAFVLFTSAYIAEIVRGGLQSVPRGQVEAAHALGLSVTRTTALIVLPQALRAVIPAIVGQFISLFKDTSLVATIGLFELLGVAQTVTKQPDFLGQGLQAETLVFASLVYWVGAYWMSRASQRLEMRLGVGQR